MPHSDIIKVTGRIEDIFAHRFVLKTSTGKLLVDMTPKGAEQVTIRSGDEITLEGEMKPSELKAKRVIYAGRDVTIDHPDHKPKHDQHHDPEPVLESVKAKGYDVLAEPRPKPKHFEVLVRRDGKVSELHVELDGRIRKEKPGKADEPKWADHKK